MPRSKTQSLNPIILDAALQGLEIQRTKLDEHIAEVRLLLGHRAPGNPARLAESNSEQQAPPHRRKLSNPARKRIAAAQQKRWAVVRAEQEKSNRAVNKSNK
jgi:hypothetical protein